MKLNNNRKFMTGYFGIMEGKKMTNYLIFALLAKNDERI